MVKYEHKTYVITAAQGIQSPYSAKMYGRDETKGSPNIPLIKNIERYVEFNKGEIQIHSVVGASVNEIELDSFFHSRNDVYIEKDSKSRNEQNRKKEEAKRKSYYDKVEKRKAKEDEYDTKKQDECKTFPVDGSDCPFNAPMHYFWEKIPKTDWPLIGERLNTNVKTLGIPVRPQNKNPLSSKDTFTKDNGGNSVIIASPKKMMRPVAQGQSGEYPHLLLTTGACTHPNYNFGDLGFMAKRDHTYGFAVVDVLDDNIHLNDIFAALSINIHEVDDPIRRNRMKKAHTNSLEEELYFAGKYLTRNAKIAGEWGGEIVVNFSNHDDMIYRWLATEKYRTDDENRLVAWKILAQDINRGNCFEKSIKLFNDIPKNVTFLKPGEDRQYWGYLCSAHGHQGTNGARGNLKNLEKAYDKIICGHVHQLEILRNAISVGTSTKIPLEYQIGNPSTSMSGNAAIYEGGIVQAIPIIKGLFAKAKTLEFLMRNKI